MKILFIGDIFGKPGRNVIKKELSNIKREYDIDLCIANCENVAAGKGVTPKTASELFYSGIDIFTSGNHLWDKKDSIDFLKTEKRIVKPLNYPKRAIGNDYALVQFNNKNIIIISLIGQAFMPAANSPFEAFEDYFTKFSKIANIIIVDFHAEATAEKRAMGFFLNGKVSAMFGTHTHIQTADEEILSEGTAYITDVGMTGPHDSVIGVKKDIILKKMLSGMPYKYEVASSGLELNGAVIEIDLLSGKAIAIQRIKRKIYV
ncbi:MAG: TIGR00282 family metallophosphoesterase [Candidatus Cloacimonetes bacterium]|nr:TIGR00282 family metallophosphoesterase [Candidatus Cloacimonadota bacterium]